MKVLHVIESLGIGGAEQALAVLLPELDALGVTVEAVVFRAPHVLAGDLRERGIAVHQIPPFNKWNLPAGAAAIARLVRQRRFDIVHAHLFFPGVYCGLGRIVRALPAKTCITFHNLAYAPGVNKPGLGLALRKNLNRLAIRFGMDGATAVSRAVADHYAETLGVRDIVLVPDPVAVASIDRMAADAVRGAGADPHPTVVLPGRIVHEKGHAVFVEAVSLLGSSIRAVIAGDGPRRSEVERQIADRQLSAQFEITGFLSHSDLIARMAQADVVVVPSLSEGFGLTAAEALCLRKPVIASRAGGLVDVIADRRTGLLVEPGDAPALASAMSQLLADPGSGRLYGEAGRQDVETRFAAPKVALQTAAFYERLLLRAD